MPDVSAFRGYLGHSRLDNGFSSLASGLGFEVVEHPIDYIDDASHPCSRRLRGVLSGLQRVGRFDAQGTSVGLWLAESTEWPQRPMDRDRIRRRTAKTLVELQPHGDARVLIILAHRDQDDFEMVFPRVRTTGDIGTVRALISRSRPNNHHLQLLSELELFPGLNLLGVSRKWADAFDVERVTKTFYVKFKAVRDRFIQALVDHNPGSPFARENHESETRRFATRNLGRILFLWFLQSKGWLDHDNQYLLNAFEFHCRTDLSHNFFRDTLVPLFFEALAVKPEHRNERAARLGELPYLDGGLFLQTHLEDELYGPDREHVQLELPNDLFDPTAPEGDSVLALLRSYRFTTQESTPDNLSVDPDPELLGKVFENLNEQLERRDTGTFYTPREIVRFMCRETLDGYLMAVAGVSKETLDRLRREAQDPESEDLRLSAEERRRIEDALRSVTVCDPAVGSGAFPVGMLQEIVELRRGLYQSADTLVSPSGQTVAEWKRETITHSLYGVDINPEAVEICQLRLWLSLVIDADRPEPLPNLDFRFVAGDSLIDRAGSDTLRHSLPAQDHLGLLDPAREQKLRDIESDVFVLQERFSQSVDPVQVRELRQQIRSLQVEATRLQIDWLREQGEAHLSDLRQQYQAKEHLGAGASELSSIKKQVVGAESRLQVIRDLLAGLDPWAPYLKPMLWPVEFPEVFAAGGFDIVVANPPYVRQERLAPADQEAFASAFPEVHRGTADLLVYFYARALQILRSDGHLGFITSNKYMRAGYGDGIRALLPTHLSISCLIDFGDLPVFEAAAYPAVLIGRKMAAPSSHALHVVDLSPSIRRELREQGLPVNVTNVREALGRLQSYLDAHGVSSYPQRLLRKEGWVLEDPRLVTLFERLMSQGTPLREFIQGRMYYGIKTGLNEAFVIDDETRTRLISEDPRSAELIKPWLRGRDIKRWRAEWAGLYIIAVQNSADAGCRNPWRGERDERVARRIFANSYPAIHDHLVPFEKRLRRRKDHGRFWWELRACAYYEKFQRVKFIWPRNTHPLEMQFSLDQKGTFVNDKAYLIPDAPLWLLGLLNSRLMRWYADKTSTKLRGSYLELKSDGVVGDFPIVIPDPSTTIEIENVVRQCVSGRAQLDSESQLDEMALDVYGCSPVERKLVSSWFQHVQEALGRVEDSQEDNMLDERGTNE